MAEADRIEEFLGRVDCLAEATPKYQAMGLAIITCAKTIEVRFSQLPDLQVAMQIYKQQIEDCENMLTALHEVELRASRKCGLMVGSINDLRRLTSLSKREASKAQWLARMSDDEFEELVTLRDPEMTVHVWSMREHMEKKRLKEELDEGTPRYQAQQLIARLQGLNTHKTTPYMLAKIHQECLNLLARIEELKEKVVWLKK
jgi:hypothetical protein